MTADFFRATLTMSSYDLEVKSDHGKEEQVEEASSGKGQAPRRQEERREKESAAGEGEGEGKKDRQSTEGCEEGRQSCAQEGQAESQGGGQEGCVQAQRGSPKSRTAADAGSNGGAGGVTGRRGTDIDLDTQYRTAGVLGIRRW